jgi:hypothetical protein
MIHEGDGDAACRAAAIRHSGGAARHRGVGRPTKLQTERTDVAKRVPNECKDPARSKDACAARCRKWAAPSILAEAIGTIDGAVAGDGDARHGDAQQAAAVTAPNTKRFSRA